MVKLYGGFKDAGSYVITSKKPMQHKVNRPCCVLFLDKEKDKSVK